MAQETGTPVHFQVVLVTGMTPISEERKGTMSPAEELRAAAKRLRERAEAATAGPWTAQVMGSEGYLVSRVHGTIRERGRSRVGRFGCKDWDGDRADAEYVASMHPPVALAVAEWLDRNAEACDGINITTEKSGQRFHDGGCTGLICEPADAPGYPHRCTCFDDALKVSRAYLGETVTNGPLSPRAAWDEAEHG